MQKKLSTWLLWTMSMAAFSQTAYHLDQMSMEALNRGLIVMRQSPDSITVSWRLLNEDPQYITFDLFAGNKSLIRNTSKTFVNLPAKDFDFSQPNVFRLTAHTDKSAPQRLQEGLYTLPANAPVGYLDIPLNKPADAGQGTPAQCRYSANDCTMADMDGDGQMEIIVKWDPSNSHDNSHQGYTGHVLVDCYSLTPLPDKQQADSALQHFLWRIDLGPNIRAGAHYTQIMAYDLDGDGEAEVVMKTGDGTVDAQGNVIGDASANHVNERGHIYKGPEYLTVFSGKTGKALYTTDYVPERGAPGLWGDLKQNRSDRYLACVGYFGNTHTVQKNGKQTEERLPSVVMCRGYYTRSTLVAWDWDGKQLTSRWFFDSYEGAELKDKGDKWVVEQPGPWGDFSSQGNHSLIVADVDSDGWDEIIYGSCTIDHDGKGLYSTKLGHGDAMHLGPMLPGDDNLYVWQCHEVHGTGTTLRDARTGRILRQIPFEGDCGRCMAADIDPTHPGYEMWSLCTNGILDAQGEVIANPRGLSFNFGIWWDGDLNRELLDRTTVSKYNWQDKTIEPVIKFSGVHSNNGTKANPSLMADIVGDWREEVIFPTLDNKHLHLYLTALPTDFRIPTLLQNVPYRMSVTLQNTAYNQPTQLDKRLKDLVRKD